MAKATMTVEMCRSEKGQTVIGSVKHLNIPRVQGVKVPAEVCFKVTKLPILHKKQQAYKTWWKKYDGSLLMLSFKLSGMKFTDSMRIRMYGRHRFPVPREVCHGESVIQMRDMTSEMASYTYSFLPKGTTLLINTDDVVTESGCSSQSPTSSTE